MLVTEVTEWCAPITMTFRKGMDRIRIYVDLSRLHHYVRRERYESPTPLEAVINISAEEARYLTVTDAIKPYRNCPLDVENHTLTTFIKTFSHFKYPKHHTACHP